MLYPFLIALFLSVFGKALFPTFTLVPFAAYLAFVIKRENRLRSLWQALLCGFILDLMAFETWMGLHTLSLVGATTLLHTQKWRLFHDKFYSLALYTFFLSLAYTLLLIGVHSLIADPIRVMPLSLIMGAIIDAIVAFCMITAPLYLIAEGKKTYLLRKNKVK